MLDGLFDFLDYTIIPVAVFYILSIIYWCDPVEEKKKILRSKLLKISTISFFALTAIECFLFYRQGGNDELVMGVAFILILIGIPLLIDVIVMNNKTSEKIILSNNKPLFINTIIVAIATILCLYLLFLKTDILNTICIVILMVLLCFVNNSIYYAIIKKRKK